MNRNSLQKQWLGGSGSINLTTTGINPDYDKTDCFIIRRCLTYLKRHLERCLILDLETMAIICWIAGPKMEAMGNFLLDFFDDQRHAEYLEELAETAGDYDDYARVAMEMLKRLSVAELRQLKEFICALINQRDNDLKYRGKSEIEKNICKLQEMFKLNKADIELCIFLFAIETYEAPEAFFDSHLNCTKFAGRKYLSNILNLDRSILNSVLNGQLSKSGILETDKYDINLHDDFICFFQNPDQRTLRENFYSSAERSPVPLNHFMIEDAKMKHILNIMKQKPKSSTHLLLYGAPGTGKTSFAKRLAQELDIPAYEIARKDNNKAESRRSSIVACINMTNSGEGSLIIVDEADNLLNTYNAWFSRGETQDKGWLNELLEQPGLRLIWITNRIDGIDKSVLRRFAFSLHFKPFNKRQRAQLWCNIIKNNKCKRFFNAEGINAYAQKYNANAGVIDLTVKKARETAPGSKNEFHRAVRLGLEAYQSLINDGQPPLNKERIEKSYSLEGLNISDDPDSLMLRLEAFDQHLRSTGGENISNMNLLFYGPPGAGKSELARYIGERLDREVICKRLSDILDKYVGESEKNIRLAFEEAEAEDAILIIDEADSILFSRQRAVRSWETSQTNEFLTRMERFRGILICTTNQLEDLDPASIRRFKHKIEFKYLTPDGNIIFYNKLLLSLLKTLPDPEAEKQIRKLENLTPGDFKTVRDQLSFCPKKKLSHSQFVAALKEEAHIKNLQSGRKVVGF